MPVRKKEIPKDGGTKVRVLSIPTIRDRVVQGALKLILPLKSNSFHGALFRQLRTGVDRLSYHQGW